MSGGAVVLAAHGSDCDDQVNAGVGALAERIAATGRFDEVVPTFHRGVPQYSAVLDQLQSSRVTVIPFMTSGGYYCDTVLPRELARNKRYSEVSIRVTQPVGVHSGMARVAAERVVSLAVDYEIALEETSLLVVGHGTRRHTASRDGTTALAGKLAQRLGVVESLPCFLEDEPTIDAVRCAARGRNIIAIVFLMTDGPHARRDVATGLSLHSSSDDRPPYVGRSGGKFVVCDAAIGADPAVQQLVVDIAIEAVTGQTSPYEGVA